MEQQKIVKESDKEEENLDSKWEKEGDQAEHKVKIINLYWSFISIEIYTNCLQSTLKYN